MKYWQVAVYLVSKINNVLKYILFDENSGFSNINYKFEAYKSTEIKLKFKTNFYSNSYLLSYFIRLNH